MKKPATWFAVLVAIALLWNLAGLLAVVSDLRLTAADIASMPADQQALYAARPIWSVVASVIAVVGGVAGCAGLLLRARQSILFLYASLVGVVFQDIGIFIVVGVHMSGNLVAYILQGMVVLIAVGLIALARLAARNSWLRENRSNGM